MKYKCLYAGLAVMGFAPGLCHADLFQAPYGPGGTWRVYETFGTTTLTFKDAWLEAQGKKYPADTGAQGHLVSITSAEKEQFVRRSLSQGAAGDVWIGLTDREGVAPGAEESQAFGTEEEANRINGWKWTNGDVYEYRNWGAGEPNNAGGAGGALGAEDAVHFGAGGWNDNQSGFDADDPVISDSGYSASENNTPPLLRYIIEYSTDSPTPLPGVRYGMVFPPNLSLNIPPNTAGNWSVQEVHDLPLARNIFDSVTQAASGEGTLFNAQVPYLDFADPFNSGNGGPTLTTTPQPYLGDTPDVDDNDILVTAKTRIIIPAAGEYTIQVRSDDGFALRVRGQNWTSIGGAGYIDPLDPTTMVFEYGTGDANTRGVLNLAAGEYDVDFVTWEGDGGAYYEVTSATGSRLNGAEAQWLPLGSTESLPAINTLNTVRLTADATVANANVRDRGNVLPAMRSIIEKAIADGTATSGLRENLELGEGDVNVATDVDDQTRMPFNNSNAPVDPPAVAVADQYITKVEGSFTLTADANGNATPGEVIDVTFGIFADDGASLRIIGQDFTAVNDFDPAFTATLADNGGDMTLTADYYTGNTNAYGLIRLTEGSTYNFVSYMYEGGGGSNLNIRWELGDLLESGFSGGQTPLRTAEVGPDDVLFMAASAVVTNSNNLFPEPFLPQARVILEEAIAQGAAQTGTTPIVLLNESTAAAGTGSITGGAFSGTRAAMPVGAADNYVTRVNGRINVDNQNGTPGENLTLTFGFFADDGADFRIVGQDFLSVAGVGTSPALEEIKGDAGIVADFPTGNTNTFGVITLTEGEYDFEGHMYEIAGGSGYEVWYAIGEFTAFDATAFRPLSTDPGILLAANTGIALAAAAVTPPPTGDFVITGFTFSAATGAYELTFSSAAGTNYAVEYTTGFQAAGDPPSPLKWNSVPGKTSVPGAAGTTTVTGNISEILAPAGQLPDAAKAFFRVRAL